MSLVPPEGLGGRYARLHAPLDLARWCGIFQTWPLPDTSAPPDGFMEQLHRYDAAAGRLTLRPHGLLSRHLADDLQFALGLEFSSPVQRWRAMTVRALEGAWRIAEAQEEETASFADLMRVLPDLRGLQAAPWADGVQILQRLGGLDDIAAEAYDSGVAGALARLMKLRDELEKLHAARRRGGRPDLPRTFFAARLAEGIAIATGTEPELFSRAGPWRELLCAAEILVGIPMGASGQGMEDVMRRVVALPLWGSRLSALAQTCAPDAAGRRLLRIADLPSAGLEVVAR